MKKRTILKLKSLFGSKKSKRQHEQQSAKSSRSPSPEPTGAVLSSRGESFRPLLRTPPPSRAGPPPSPPVPMHPVAPVPPEPSGPLPLCPCPVCGRTFVPQSLAKHVKICEKMTVKKRKTFDSSRQRREGVTANSDKFGTDLEQYLPKNFGLPENSPFLEKSPPNTAKATPKPKVQSVRSAIMKPTADLQKCPHCNRNFGIRAFERHVEWCADKAKILPAAPAQPPPHIADAKQRLNARTQYKAPLARGRRSSQTRDKSSNSRSASVESSRGVSPPHPREYGDYRHGRTRTSESMSSNDCHEDSSPHIPVIKNARVTQNSSTGDANVKARQARLARDLSSSRNTQDPQPSQIQSSSTDPNIVKSESQNKKVKLNKKKQQQLKKLEQIANRHSERSQKIVEEQKCIKIKQERKDCTQKSQIPVPKKTNICTKEIIQDNDIDSMKTCNVTLKTRRGAKIPHGSSASQVSIKEKEIKVKKEKNRHVTDSAISLDSLEESHQNTTDDKHCQSIGINTELLCPCVPCVIHITPDPKQIIKNKNASTKTYVNAKKRTMEQVKPTVELLYRNPKMVTSYDIQSKEIYEIHSEDFINENNIHANNEHRSYKQHTNEITVEMFESDKKSNYEYKSESQGNDDDYGNLSAEKFEENYEHDLSEDNFNDSIDKRYSHCDSGDEENINEELGGRHGSGDTYTKFSENPTDLEEFFTLTNNIMNNESNEKILKDNDIETLHTPRTNSIEALNKLAESTKEKATPSKYLFSDTLGELKNDFQDLLNNASASNAVDHNIMISDKIQENRKVSDMEHIVIYEIKATDQISEKNNEIQEESKLKLPAITETNRFSNEDHRSRKKLASRKSASKYKLLSEQKRSNREYRTFTVDERREESDGQSITSEAPPFKLPRIELKRLDDNYDPFVSAARQMKELMSSDTNLPKKMQNSTKDPSRTLPILRNTKEKTPTNSKMLKDSINKTYQKTPTLQRMKSFGSTNNDNTNDNTNNSFGGRCSSFRINRNDKKSSQKLNTTYTKSSKENISSVEKTYFTRNSALNKSFSSYTNSSYSTPKPKDKIPKIATSMHHGFQRTTIKQPLKLDKIKRDEEKKDFVNLDSILAFDNISLADSNYIDPRLINENDNLPINVNTILNNPDIISSMESLLTTENLPSKFESFSTCNVNNKPNKSLDTFVKNENNNNLNMNKLVASKIGSLGTQYDKILSSLEQSITSKTSARDDDSLCEDFDLEEFMTSFDEEVHKQRPENKRISSSTTRVVKQCELSKQSFETHAINSPKIESNRNGMIPVNKSTSLVFSSNNIVGDKLFPSSVKRSTSLLDSLQKKTVQKLEGAKGKVKPDQLEEDLMKSLKDFDKFYENERIENCQSSKEFTDGNKNVLNGSAKKDSHKKIEHRRAENLSNGNYTPNGKASNDSAYSSLNRISPSKLSVCNAKELNGDVALDRLPAVSDTNSSQKDDVRSESSDEFLAMERSAELEDPLSVGNSQMQYKELKLSGSQLNEKRASSRASSRRSPTWQPRQETLSSSGSETSLHRARRDSGPAPRLSRFCHECGSRFPVDTAKFCIECGVKRLAV